MLNRLVYETILWMHFLSCIFPFSEITLSAYIYLFWIFPITLTRKYVAFCSLGIRMGHNAFKFPSCSIINWSIMIYFEWVLYIHKVDVCPWISKHEHSIFLAVNTFVSMNSQTSVWTCYFYQFSELHIEEWDWWLYSNSIFN